MSAVVCDGSRSNSDNDGEEVANVNLVLEEASPTGCCSKLSSSLAVATDSSYSDENRLDRI